MFPCRNIWKVLELIQKNQDMDTIAISGIYYEMGFLRISDKLIFTLKLSKPLMYLFLHGKETLEIKIMSFNRLWVRPYHFYWPGICDNHFDKAIDKSAEVKALSQKLHGDQYVSINIFLLFLKSTWIYLKSIKTLHLLVFFTSIIIYIKRTKWKWSVCISFLDIIIFICFLLWLKTFLHRMRDIKMVSLRCQINTLGVPVHLSFNFNSKQIKHILSLFSTTAILLKILPQSSRCGSVG